MISTTDLTAAQLLQLDALLAETTTGCVHYRPPVVRDVDVLQDLECAELVRWTHDCGYEITDAGREIVIEHAMYAAEGAEFVQCAGDDELQATIEHLKAELPRLGDLLRQRAMADIEICQDELDDRAHRRTEGTGRHRVVPGDDRPTEVLPAAVEQTVIGSSSGTLDNLPCDPDGQATVRLIAAIRATPTPDELAELAAIHAAGWQALEADLGDERPWWRRNLTPRRVLALSVIASIVVTWFVAWLVMA